MSKAIILNNELQKNGEVALPERFKEIHSHNLYLYVKSYLASLRANSAKAKKRGEVSGGGKKPWSQKGGGRARAGSITSPVFVGGGVSHGPSNNRNYDLKVNKKQKKLALQYALMEKAEQGKLYVVDSLQVDSGKTKDAYAMFKTLNERSTLFVSQISDEKTFLAFRNLKECYLADANELNAYLVAAFRSVVIEKSLFENITKEG
ncbi:50S ribosomal protein L4 [Wolinella succinogenes]|uniref:Large ribosomal subunit protein uL4 n=1 Tax=Wolinella succinogenes (strain ATCC 29543 / DSM 1740 / CCUG 13145 / JCM 31913 / LMG 7466 / NCTC 11488 / FDC 602W) TaxID=273121 RepID=RL4_WOLSU|nr:50S ribosomal protein L4 [Wolinella succinogenes]Q7M8D5.1 RecName: Full=Large ribosomal subunit protein uL4; AltName: Full=50S ribosomal protein L4 [Wolinella succinogenes DSM 1740]HCZ18582.1 50S ribosomal protein L4 [Helicobacter sp.]NLU34670.1 50S ribosomal protein L4 [Wolinella succinogenes]CAE10741.1 50S RIBOSOMAL PROTEIN L4 [Wolinella succinogenes]VEG80891.1 50S ribosomal protein L4 [Wolinella succinogenes]